MTAFLFVHFSAVVGAFVIGWLLGRLLVALVVSVGDSLARIFGKPAVDSARPEFPEYDQAVLDEDREPFERPTVLLDASGRPVVGSHPGRASARSFASRYPLATRFHF